MSAIRNTNRSPAPNHGLSLSTSSTTPVSGRSTQNAVLNLSLKTYEELDDLQIHLESKNEIWKRDVRSIKDEQVIRENEIEKAAALIEKQKEQIHPLEEQQKILSTEEIRITALMQDLQKQVSIIQEQTRGVTKEIEAKNAKLAENKEVLDKLRMDYNHDRANLPLLERNCAELQQVLDEVQCFKQMKRGKKRTSDDILNEQGNIFTLLLSSKHNAADEKDLFEDSSLDVSVSANALALEQAETDSDEEQEEFDFNSLPPRTVQNTSAAPERRDKVSRSSNKKQKGVEDAKKIRVELEGVIEEIRQLFREQHLSSIAAFSLLQCTRREGQWRVSEGDRSKHQLRGIQGSTSMNQSFLVRYKNQVISQKMLDLNLVGDRVEATFADPRDASAVHEKIAQLFSTAVSPLDV
jgi:hypothetical protein